MHADRLLKLARHVEKLKPEQFHFGSVCGQTREKGQPECGSYGCLMGHAPEALNGEGKIELHILKLGAWASDSKWSYNGIFGLAFLDAAQLVFGLSRNQACELFVNGPIASNPTRRQAANHIRKFVKDNS